jgi:hypothetical protein
VLEVVLSVSGPRLLVVQVLLREGSVDVKNQVDTGRGHQGHALIVVESRVNGVDTDGVDSELLEEEDVTSTGVDVGERV